MRVKEARAYDCEEGTGMGIWRLRRFTQAFGDGITFSRRFLWTPLLFHSSHTWRMSYVGA